MSDEEKDSVPMAECGACRTVIPLDSEQCPECNTRFSGVSEEALGECGACQQLVPLDSTRCPECGVVFVADDVVDILRSWVHSTGINIRKLFDKFDENSDGTIDSSELKSGLLGLNLADLPPSQVERLVAEIDADGNGVIDLDEFESILMGDSEGGSGAETQEISAEEVPDQGEIGLDYSENVLSQVMKSHDIDESEKEAFVAFAANHNDDGNSYLKKEELEAAATSWNEQDAPDEEESADEEVEESAEDIVVVDEEEPHHEETDSEESEDVDVESTESHEEEEDEVAAEDSEIDEADDEGIDHEEFDLEDDSEEPEVHPLQALADMMDEHEISAQRMFNELDVDGNGLISLSELTTSLTEKYGDVLEDVDIESIMEGVDGDGDGMIDVTEFIGSLETLEDHDEAVETHAPEKEFPTIWQKRMMSKTWNDSVWPIVHVGFGLLIVLVLVNAMVGPVDGSGGNVVYQAMDSGIVPPSSMGLVDGVTVYPCDNEFQNGGCKNSLTPLAGTEGASSMPKGFYWDGVLLLLISIVGIAGSLFLHLVKAPAWRARAKAMKEFTDDKADAAEAHTADEDEVEDDSMADDSEGDEHEDVDVDIEEEMEGDEDDEGGDGGDEDDEDTIDVGSHIGLVLDDEEVFGTILEFDDEEGTVTIEEDGTGDLVTGYQDDMFLE